MAGANCFFEVEVGGIGVPLVLAGMLLEVTEEVDKGGMISGAILGETKKESDPIGVRMMMGMCRPPTSE